jgi:hypothetical protein
VSVTVYTTTGNTYTVANGSKINLNGIAPTGELAVTVFGTDPDTPLGSFGSVEAVYQTGEVVMTAAPATAANPFRQ